MGYSRTETIESAIKYGASVGRRLQSEAPQIAYQYRHGMFQRDIARGIDTLLERLGATSEDVKARAVGFAIRGYPGGHGVEPFKGLIEDKAELEMLAKEHMMRMTPEQRIEAGRKGGTISGRRAFKQKKGLFSEGYEERIRKAGRNSAIARGVKMWDERRVVDGLGEMTEEEYTCRLSLDPNYRDQKNKSRYNGARVMDQVNAVFNNSRTLDAIHKIISKARRRKK